MLKTNMRNLMRVIVMMMNLKLSNKKKHTEGEGRIAINNEHSNPSWWLC